MNIEIRKATVDEAEYISLLARVTFREAFAKDAFTDDLVLRDYLSSTFSVKKIRASIEKENNVYWLAFADELPVGYAKLKKFSPYEKLNDDSPAHLQKIYVLNDLKGNRIGEKLQNALFDEVAKHGIKTLWLAVWDRNHKPIRFYKRHGFQKETTYHYDYKTMSFDYEVMVRSF